MLVKIETIKGYLNLTHDVQDEGYNDPDDPSTWDFHGPGTELKCKKMCKINGSEFMTPEELGNIIRGLVKIAREQKCPPYYYYDLAKK